MTLKIDYQDHYNDEYWTHRKQYHNAAGQLKTYYGPSLSWEGFDWVAKSISRVWSPGSLIDIGCGAGDLSGRLTSLGFQCRGVDISQYAVDNAHPNMRGRIRCEDITKNPDLGKFDYVMSTDLLEHIYLEDLQGTFDWMLGMGNKFFFLVAITNGEEFIHTKGDPIPSKWEETAISGHIHVRKPSYWISFFEKNKLRIDWKRMYMFQALRETIPAWRDTGGWGHHFTYFLEKTP